jgi:hypothetical protein
MNDEKVERQQGRKWKHVFCDEFEDFANFHKRWARTSIREPSDIRMQHSLVD